MSNELKNGGKPAGGGAAVARSATVVPPPAGNFTSYQSITKSLSIFLFLKAFLALGKAITGSVHFQNVATVR